MRTLWSCAGLAAAALAGPAVPAQSPPAGIPTARPAASPRPALEGTVINPAGKPVDKALVLAAPLASRRQAPASTRTDARGRFLLPLPRGGVYTVRVEAEGLAAHVLERLAVPAKPIAVTLARGRTIEGVVRDDRGRPVPRARVEAQEPGWATMGALDAEAGRVRTTTDAAGAFRLGGLRPGSYTLRASAPRLGGAVRPGVKAGTRLELFLVSGAGVRGIVHGPGRKPVDGALVRLEPAVRLHRASRAERTGPDGTFAFWGVEPGGYRVIAHHATLAPDLATVAVDSATEPFVALTLGEGVRLRGRMVDASGRPLAGLAVLQEVEGQPVAGTLGERLRAESDARGHFAIERVPAASAALGVVADGFAPRRVEVSPVGPDHDLGDVILEPGLSLRGRVRDTRGRPVADALLFASTSGMSPRRDAYEASSGADGRFVIAGVEPGQYGFMARASGFAPTPRRVMGTAGGDEVEIVMEPAGVITGTVVDERGAPVDVFAVATEGGAGSSSRFPQRAEGREGRFTVDGVSAGEWSVVVNADEWAEARADGIVVVAGRTTDAGRIRLQRGALLRGRVTDAAGSPVAGAFVAVETPERRRVQSAPTASDGSGAFEVRGLSAGRYDLVAEHPRYAPARVTGIDIEAGRPTAEARITLTAGGRIEGMARGPARAMAGAHVRLMSGAASAGQEALVRPDGSFTLEHVAAGPAGVLLMVPSGSSSYQMLQRRDVTVQDGATATVEFHVREILISGRVTRRGEPAANVRVTMRGQGAFAGRSSMPVVGEVAPPATGPQRGWAVTREDGGYELLVDQPGRYTVDLAGADGRWAVASREMVVPDAEAHAADFALTGITISGQVVDAESGQPLAATVIAVPKDGERRLARGEAGADGAFAVEVDAGAHAVSAAADGYGRGQSEVTAAGAGVSGLRLALPRALSITGSVRDAAGRVPTSVHVFAESSETPPRPAGMGRARSDGRFTIDGLSGGRYTLVASAESGGLAIVPGIAAGGANVDVRLGPTVRVRAHALTAEGAPAAGVGISVASVDGRRLAFTRGHTTGADGVAELEVPPGAIGLRAWAPGVQGSATLTVEPGQPAEVEIRLAAEKAPR